MIEYVHVIRKMREVTENMEIIYSGGGLVVAEKTPGSVCEDAESGSLLREVSAVCGKKVYPVHRIDRIAGGCVLYALSPRAAEEVRSAGIHKTYLFVTVGSLPEKNGRLYDLLYHDQAHNKTFTVTRMRRGVREAELTYEVMAECDGLALVSAELITGRTHQIRVQFASRGTPLAGDSRYGGGAGVPALWSHSLTFVSHGKKTTVCSYPPDAGYWKKFDVREPEKCRT